MKLLEKYTALMRSTFGDDCCYVLNIRPVGGARFI